MRNTTRALLLAAAAGLLGACGDVTGGETVSCNTTAPAAVSTKGDTVTTNVGLRYIETKVGTGETAQICQYVTINYDLYVAGKSDPFDTSTGKAPATFLAGAGGVNLVGIDVGIAGMKVGGIRRLIIPPPLGFGGADRLDSSGNVVVPGGSTLIADVELKSLGAVVE
jgi:FKBP-type peptidyl-prolyl cis-trans isomerase